jgi:peptidyl-prolyl cis-trans isomerase C
MTAGEFEDIVNSLPPQAQAQVQDPVAKRRAVEELLKIKLMATEAEKRKLDQDPKFKAQMEMVRQQLLAQQLASTLENDEPGDKKYFDEHPEVFGQVQARHILISTQPSKDPKKPTLTDEAAKKKADDIRARLVKGEDFSKMAKVESDDPGVVNNGGEYTFGHGRMMPAFEEASFALKDGEISQPVKTPYGYHVIQLVKHLPGKFDEARAAIGKARMEQLVKDAAGGAEVKVAPEFGGDSEPAAKDGKDTKDSKDTKDAKDTKEAKDTPKPATK